MRPERAICQFFNGLCSQHFLTCSLNLDLQMGAGVDKLLANEKYFQESVGVHYRPKRRPEGHCNLYQRASDRIRSVRLADSRRMFA